ncbi:hypothetical protein FLW53_23265 [Microbispora sp. SCL1-1]|uniref:hypothetical protein n=1 Tax=unclassified Microbispora TaxID=2614687 RepID=UPI001159CD27|nr:MULTISPECIES: hypothetical protein [unclassified Microbispora]NJP27063.1 hypothetical protein [Microbispora sp. CL1-1]TQS11411.1 hypothetical protein FLW53_23265 [Microbispora sp. SCL1-1]
MSVAESSELPEPERFAWGRAGDCLAIVHAPGCDRRVIAAVAAAVFEPADFACIREALGFGSRPPLIEVVRRSLDGLN